MILFQNFSAKSVILCYSADSKPCLFIQKELSLVCISSVELSSVNRAFLLELKVRRSDTRPGLNWLSKQLNEKIPTRKQSAN